MRTLRRRRKEQKTNYSKRLKLLKSGKPRIIFRKSNNYVLAQYVESKEAQDTVKITIDSKRLLKYGWPEEAKSGLKSITASYLLGLLLGKEIKDAKLEPKAIMDFGMLRNVHKSKIYGFVKGVNDAGIDLHLSNNEKIFPDEKRLKGEHLKNKVPFEEILKRISKPTKSEKQDSAGEEIKSKIEE